MEQPRIFVVSDLHLNHKNIIQYSRPQYSSVEEMNEDIVNKWNSVVRNDDIVYNLGDIYLGNKTVAKSLLQRLNGRHRVIKGNHDSYKDLVKLNIFERVYDKPILIDGYVILSHEPIDYLNVHSPFVNIYGHLHDDATIQTYTPFSACVSIERINMTPIRLKTVYKMIEKQKDLLLK